MSKKDREIENEPLKVAEPTAIYAALEVPPKGIRQKEELKLSLLIDYMI